MARVKTELNCDTATTNNNIAIINASVSTFP